MRETNDNASNSSVEQQSFQPGDSGLQQQQMSSQSDGSALALNQQLGAQTKDASEKLANEGVIGNLQLVNNDMSRPPLAGMDSQLQKEGFSNPNIPTENAPNSGKGDAVGPKGEPAAPEGKGPAGGDFTPGTKAPDAMENNSKPGPLNQESGKNVQPGDGKNSQAAGDENKKAEGSEAKSKDPGESQLNNKKNGKAEASEPVAPHNDHRQPAPRIQPGPAHQPAPLARPRW